MDSKHYLKSDADGRRKSDQQPDNDDRCGSSDCIMRPKRRTVGSKIHPFQEILNRYEEHGESYDLGRDDTSSSTRDVSVPSSGEVTDDLLEIQRLPLDRWDTLSTDQESADAHVTEHAAPVVAAVTSSVLEQAHIESEGMSVYDCDDTEPNNQSLVVSEELMNAEAIQRALNDDSSDDKDDGGDDEHSTPCIDIRPGAQHVYPSRHVISEDTEDDASVVYDLFHNRPASPYQVEAIPEAVPVDLDISFEHRASVASASVPPSAMSFTSELKNKDTLLRRQVLVDDIISKLQDSCFRNESLDCDESQNVVLLRGCGGVGKSVLCSLVVSSRSTLFHFADGIAWLSLSRIRGEGIAGGMTFDMYVDFLESICDQLDLEVPTFNEPIFLAADSPSTKHQKERAAMEAARATMCRLLNSRYVLVVLDDVWNRSAIPWLNFSNRLDSHLRVLVSTRLQGSFREAKVIDVGTLSLQEARTLLMRESGCRYATLTSEEEALAVDIAERCSLPVAVCIAGRRLACSVNRHKAFQELANEMSDGLALRIDHNDTMFQLTDRCFVGASGELMKTSFVAFSVTFRERAFVPTEAATKLFDAFLSSEDRACINGTVSILHQLHDMGLLERKGDMFKIRHELGQEYAKKVLNDKCERAMLFTKRLSRVLGKKLASRSTKKSSETLVSALHFLFVKEYTAQVSIECYLQTATINEYLFEQLPWHIMSSSYHHSLLLARNILCSPSFLKQRVNVMGMLPCIKAQIHDIEMLDRKTHTRKETKVLQNTIDAAFEVILEYIASEEEVVSHDAGKAYMLLALSFQQQFRFVNAMEMYSRAYAVFQREGLEEEAAWVQTRAEKIAFKPMCLVQKSTASDADIVRFEGVAHLLAQQEHTSTKETQSIASKSSHSDLGTSVELTLSSHPGMAICLSDRCQKFPGWDSHYLCLGPAESAISVEYKGDRFSVCNGGNRSCLIAGASRGGEGDMLHMATYRYNNNFFSKKIDKMYEKTKTSDLVVNEDGSMSPRTRRDLVFATRLPHFFLVKRDSPCRLILKNGNALKTNHVPFASQDDVVSQDKVFSGELLSHPGYGICHDVVINATSNISGDQMKLDSSDSIQLVYDGKKIASVVDGKCKYFLTNALGTGDVSSKNQQIMMYLVRDESRTIFKSEFEFGLHWIINEDGSVSPAECPSHAIGIHSLSSTELILSEGLIRQARIHAQRLVRKRRGLSLQRNLRFFRLIAD